METTKQTHPHNPDLHPCFDDVQVPVPIPHRQFPEASRPLSTDAMVKEAPLNDRLRGRARLVHLGWDRTAQTLHLPTLTKNGEWIYSQPD